MHPADDVNDASGVSHMAMFGACLVSSEDHFVSMPASWLNVFSHVKPTNDAFVISTISLSICQIDFPRELIKADFLLIYLTQRQNNSFEESTWLEQRFSQCLDDEEKIVADRQCEEIWPCRAENWVSCIHRYRLAHVEARWDCRTWNDQCIRSMCVRRERMEFTFEPF